MPDDHDDLRAAAADLEDALAGLRAELDREPEGPDGEPSPEETLRVVEEVAIPTVEGLVAANLQTLEATREAVRAARKAADDGDANADVRERDAAAAGESSTTDRAGDAAGDERAGDDYAARDPGDVRPVDADAHERVDEAVEKVRSALDGSSIPDDAPGSDLVNEARDLRTEIDEQVDDASERGDDRSDGGTDAATGDLGAGPTDESDAADGERSGVEVPVETGTPPDDAGSDALQTDDGGDDSESAAPTDLSDASPYVDVEAELDTIRDEVQENDAEPPPWADDGDASDASDDGHDADGDPAGDGAVDDSSGGPGDGSVLNLDRGDDGDDEQGTDDPGVGDGGAADGSSDDGATDAGGDGDADSAE